MLLVTLVLVIAVFIWLEQLVVKYYKLIKETKEVNLSTFYLGVFPYTVVVLVQTVVYGIYMTFTTLNLDKYVETLPLTIILTNGFLLPILITNLVVSIKIGFPIKSVPLLVLPTALIIGTANTALIKVLAMVGLVLYVTKLFKGDLGGRSTHKISPFKSSTN